MKTVFSTVCCALIVAHGANAQSPPKADEFIPIAQGGPATVKNPKAVKTEGKNLISASDAQDAINAAVMQNKKELQGGTGKEVGATMVKYPSGLGFVATGAATYRTVENPVLTRIAKRKAYVIAFAVAKRHLAEILSGLSTEGKESVRLSLENVNLPKEELTNIAADSKEAITQAVEMMLRGFVIYEVHDDTKQNTVMVSIVTTPKTRGKLDRPAPHMVKANSLTEGLEQVIQEVRTGVVPPVGARIIDVKTTGETAYVGFGSSVVRTSSNAAVQARLNLDAQKIAGMRSKDSLCGLVIGDLASWRGSVVDSLKDEIQEFQEVKKDDPLSKTTPGGVLKLEKARQTLVSKMKADDLYESARIGKLPPGVITRTWFDEDHAWSYSMSVYIPSASKAAADTAKEMKGAKIIRVFEGSVGGTDGSGFTDEKNPNIRRPSEKTKPGPSGKIEPEQKK
jgi:hypothetical protein